MSLALFSRLPTTPEIIAAIVLRHGWQEHRRDDQGLYLSTPDGSHYIELYAREGYVHATVRGSADDSLLDSPVWQGLWITGDDDGWEEYEAYRGWEPD